MNERHHLILQMAENIIAPGSRYTLSSIIEDSITDMLINQYGEAWQDEKELYLAAYQSLRSDFSLDTYRGDIPYFYSMYYLPLNISKVQLVLLDLMKRRSFGKEIDILDVGSGVGTTAFAVVDYITILDNLCQLVGDDPFFDRVHLDSIEGSKDNIHVFANNLSYLLARMKEYNDLGKFDIDAPMEMDITKQWKIAGYYDIIIFSNILNEISYAKRKQLIKEAANNLKENGVIIIIEPANRDNGAALNQLKWDVVKEDSLNVLTPCGLSEKCKGCWIFRTEHSSRSRLIQYFEDIYQWKQHDTFYNDWLKWIYTILSKNEVIYPSTDLDTLHLNEEVSCYFHIVSKLDRRKNQFKICDGCGTMGNYNLDISHHPMEKAAFGDFVYAENVIIKESSGGKTICLTDHSTIVNLTGKRTTDKLKLDNVNEKSLRFILKRFWGHDEFREGQFDIIKNALQDISTLGILPTGAGKSLCFQLPAILKTGISIVVSPLKSLMKDQVDHLHRIGFEFVDYIDSSMNTTRRREMLNRFKGGFIKILYLSPERLQIQSFQNEIIRMLQDTNIDYFIIDEAHCASEWGHDFRPAYLKIVDIVKKLNHPPLLALTATASPRVRDDIVEIFELDANNVMLPRTFNRKELSLEVVTVDINQSKSDALRNTLMNRIPQVLHNGSLDELHEKGSGIVFTIYADPRGKNTRPFGTEYITETIQGWGVPSQRYHSQLDDDSRIRIQDQYIQDDIPLLVSTKGFGMGIDKPNIDYIVHMCYSNSLEAYYQEAGRAGRDKEHAHIVLIATRRHPQCIQQNSRSLGSNEPRCVNRWTCEFTRGSKCDYGMQAKFIHDEYPEEISMKQDISGFVSTLMHRMKDGNELYLISQEKDFARNQKYLYYLQKEGLVQDYVVVEYLPRGIKIHIILDRNFSRISITGIVNSITERLQDFKKQKYHMLESIWGYVSNNTICRRQYLLNYFGDPVTYDGGCQFCDIEGISDTIIEDLSPDAVQQELFNELRQLLDSEIFMYERTYELQMNAYKEGIHELVKIRSMRHLEDYPNNIAALYLTGIISFRRDSRGAYGQGQIYQCLTGLMDHEGGSSATEILIEIIPIHEAFTFEMIKRMDSLFNDAALLHKLMVRIENEDIRNSLYMEYLKRRLGLINRKLEGWVKNEHRSYGP